MSYNSEFDVENIGLDEDYSDEEYLTPKYQPHNYTDNNYPEDNFSDNSYPNTNFSDDNYQDDDCSDEDSSYDSSIATYFNTIKNYPVLSVAEEKELAKKIAEGDEQAKNKFINSNLRLVVYFAKKYRTKNLDLIDAIQEGNLGLLRAIESFDYTKGCKFSTYASYWIKQAISRAIADKDELIKIPIHTQENLKKYAQVCTDFYAQNKRQPTDEEVSDIMDISLYRIQELKFCVTDTFSLNAPLSEDQDSEIGDIIADVSAVNPEEAFFETFKGTLLQEIFEKANLSYREETIIKLRYGINCDRAHSLEAIAQKFGITRERVRQLEAKALGKLKRTVTRFYKKKSYL